MAWLEQCEVCGGGGFFCCHRNNPDLNRAAGAGCPHEGGGGPGLVQEFQFFGRPGGGNLAWLLGEAGDGEDRTPQPPVAPALWDADGRWPALDGGFSISASSKPPPLAEAAVAGPATAAGATVPFFGCADAPNADAMEADKAASSGKDDSSGSVMDREARVLRYREKKKRRKFGKQIRYASRKAYAEARPRIRGRFVKAPEAEGTMMTPPPPLQLPLPLPPQAYDAGQVDVGWLRAFRP